MNATAWCSHSDSATVLCRAVVRNIITLGLTENAAGGAISKASSDWMGPKNVLVFCLNLGCESHRRDDYNCDASKSVTIETKMFRWEGDYLSSCLFVM